MEEKTTNITSIRLPKQLRAALKEQAREWKLPESWTHRKILAYALAHKLPLNFEPNAPGMDKND